MKQADECPESVPGARALLGEMFASRLVASGACWLWTGTKDRGGYGVVTVSKQHWRSHRLAWHTANGRLADPLPSHVQIRHTCDVRLCCNPAHLIPGTAAENAQDAVDRGRTAGGRPLEVDHGGNVVLDIVAMRAARIPVRVIAERLGTSERNVYYHLSEMKKLAALTGDGS